MEKKLVIQELNRMRELMGMKTLSESSIPAFRNLLSESGKRADEILPLSPTSIDNLIRHGIYFRDDLGKLSDEFTARGIKTFDDLGDAIALKQGVDIANITDDMIESYMKNDETLYKSILEKAANAAEEQVDLLIRNVNIETLFTRNPQQLDVYKTFLSTAPTERNIDGLIEGINDSLDEIAGIIDDIEGGLVPGVNTVPRELEDLYEQLIAKETDITNYKNRSSSSQPNPNPNLNPNPAEATADEIELARLRRLRELEAAKNDVVSEVKKYIKSDNDWNKIGWWPTWMGNSNKKQVLLYIDQMLGKYNYEQMRKLALDELGRIKTKRDLGKELKGATWVEKFLKNNPKTVSMTIKIGIVSGLLAAVYYGFAASYVKGAYENNKNVVIGTEIDDCFKTVTGWSDITDESKTLFTTLGYGCQNRNKDEAPNDFITSVKYQEADPTKGTASKFIITIGGQVKEVLTSGNKPVIIPNPSPNPSPNPGPCVWKSDDEAIAALKKTFKSAKDKDITVDLSNCKVTYYNPTLEKTDTFGPTDL